MRFDKGLRSAGLKPYPAGYIAPPTEGFNAEDPFCQWGDGRDAGQWLDDPAALPAVIELQVSLTPVWIEAGTASVCVGGYPACPLYAPLQVISQLCVSYQGAGQYQQESGDTLIPFVGNRFAGYTLDLPQPYLYGKEFAHQPEGRQIQWAPRQGEHGAILPLWAYGGQQMEGDIHPAVCTVGLVREKTQVVPSSLLYWREQGITPFQGAVRGRDEVIFQDAFSKDQTRTFRESIEAGMATFDLGLGVDERGDSVRAPYVSYRLSKTGLSFRKGEA